MDFERNIIKGFFVLECISVEEGNVMYGMYGWVFNLFKFKFYFFFGREEGGRRGS